MGVRTTYERLRPWLGWTFGVVGPLYCSVVAIWDAGGLPFEYFFTRLGLLTIASAASCAMAASLLEPDRRGGPAAFLAGALAVATLYALLHAVFLAPLAALGIVVLISAPDELRSWLLVPALVAPLVALPIYASDAWYSVSRGTSTRPWRLLVCLGLGFMTPILFAAVLAVGSRSVEARVIATYVDGPDRRDPSHLSDWRPWSHLHDWTDLERVLPPGPPGESSDARERAAWDTLVALVGEENARRTMDFD